MHAQARAATVLTLGATVAHKSLANTAMRASENGSHPRLAISVTRHAAGRGRPNYVQLTARTVDNGPLNDPMALTSAVLRLRPTPSHPVTAMLPGKPQGTQFPVELLVNQASKGGQRTARCRKGGIRGPHGFDKKQRLLAAFMACPAATNSGLLLASGVWWWRQQQRQQWQWRVLFRIRLQLRRSADLRGRPAHDADPDGDGGFVQLLHRVYESPAHRPESQSEHRCHLGNPDRRSG